MNPWLLLLFEALVFTVSIGLFSLMRGEGLSVQFACEALGLTALAIGLGAGFGLSINPILFLFGLYLITRRARVLTDVGNFLSRWGYPRMTVVLNRLALRLWPDWERRAIVLINLGAAYMRSGALDEAADTFRQALAVCPDGLGPLHSAVAHLNLGNVYRRQGQSQQAIREFQAAIRAFPGSLYEHRAQLAIREIMRPKRHEEGEEPEVRP